MSNKPPVKMWDEDPAMPYVDFLEKKVKNLESMVRTLQAQLETEKKRPK